MYFSHHTIIILSISTVIIPTESKDSKEENNKQNVEYLIPRRFIDDLTDDEWHVAHLKRPKEDARKSGCKRTFEDLLKRYRKDMKSDAGAINFVSADPLPFNEKDLIDDSCKVNDNFEQTKVGGTVHSNNTVNGTLVKKDTTKEDKNFSHPNIRSKDSKFDDELKSVSDIVKLNVTKNLDVNSTLRSNSTEDDDLKDGVTVADEEFMNTTDKNQTVRPNLVKLDTFSNSSIFTTKATTKDDKKEDDKDQVRRSEYMFSSMEYYDETIEFDPSTCPPDTVDVVIPELEMIKDYDVECILSLEWRCLE